MYWFSPPNSSGVDAVSQEQKMPTSTPTPTATPTPMPTPNPERRAPPNPSGVDAALAFAFDYSHAVSQEQKAPTATLTSMTTLAQRRPDLPLSPPSAQVIAQPTANVAGYPQYSQHIQATSQAQRDGAAGQL
ncbi:hypothetical protein BGZ46_004214 [Entomortierella lignicola]|nr:hypothetical protein BGZ46_004214 [Entomortierella lignicola]